MTKIAIPSTPPDLGPNSDFQTNIFRKNREAVLSELRCLSGIPEIARTLNPDAVYKIVCSPEGGKLYTDTAGNLKGVFYKDGKIVQHAKLRAVGPSLVKCATAVGSQILLIYIAIQLNEIQKGISKILDGQNMDRRSEIFAGINLYRQAMFMRDSEHQSMQIQLATQTLNEGIAKTIPALSGQIDEIPDPAPRFFENWPLFGQPTTKRVAQKLEPAVVSFRACVAGIETLAECYATINEPEAADYALTQYLSDLKSCRIESVAKKARGVPVRDSIYPEKPWQDFIDREPSISDDMKNHNHLKSGRFDTIEIEVKPVELLEGGE